jgi:hypothetical protein
MPTGKQLVAAAVPAALVLFAAKGGAALLGLSEGKLSTDLAKIGIGTVAVIGASKLV